MVDVWFGLTPGMFAHMCVARAWAYTHLMRSVCSCGPMASCPNPSSIYFLAGAFRWRHYQFWPRSTASSQSTSKKTTTSSSPTPHTLFLVPQWAFYCCSRPRYPTTTTKWRSRSWHPHATWHRQLASPQKQKNIICNKKQNPPSSDLCVDVFQTIKDSIDCIRTLSVHINSYGVVKDEEQARSIIKTYADIVS